MMTLYWGIGNDYKPTNLINISALLYMWAILPGFAALTYVPSLVLERPLFIRYVQITSSRSDLNAALAFEAAGAASLHWHASLLSSNHCKSGLSAAFSSVCWIVDELTFTSLADMPTRSVQTGRCIVEHDTALSLRGETDGELSFLRRERSDGLYKVITYLSAKLLEELTVGLIGSLVFSCVVFFPSKFQGQWLLFWLTYWCTMSIGIGESSALQSCTQYTHDRATHQYDKSRLAG